MNALKTALFVLLVPGSVLVVIPVNLLLPLEKNAIDLGIFAWLALPLWIAGLEMMLWCAIDFVRKGQGTPALVDAPKKLVVSGLYRFMRNPMYMGVLVFADGNLIWTGSLILTWYMFFLWLAFHTFVLTYEEPHLRQIFGAEYEQYCRAVPRWLPRFSR